MGDIGDNVRPVYRFEWNDADTRTTEDLGDAPPEAIEKLAELGKADPSCDVTLLRYET